MSIRRFLILSYAAALGAASGAATLVEWGSSGWIGEVLANLRLHLALGNALLASAALLLPISLWRRVPLVAFAAALAVLHLYPLLPYIAQPPPQALQVSDNAARLRLLSANLDSWAVDIVALEKLLRNSGADIVVLTEITFTQQAVFQSLRDIYPQQFETPVGRDNTFIVRVLARRPMDVVVYHPIAYDHPVVQARFCSAEPKCLTVLSAHAPRPGPNGRAVRDMVLQAIATQAREAHIRGDDVIAAGDFNITAFSPDFAIFAQAGLTDSALGRGYPSTWPYFLHSLGIGIDQVLVSPGIGVAARWLGPDIHSDHFPLFVELQVPNWR